MTALLLVAIAAAIACVAALIALKRWTRALDKHTGRHTEAAVNRRKAEQRDQKRANLARFGVPPEEADAMGPSGVWRTYQRASVTAPQQAIKELTGKAVT